MTGASDHLSIICPCLLSAAHDNTVVDEKFTAEDEEKDDAGDDFRGVVIEIELRGNLDGALAAGRPAGRRSESSQRC